MATWIWPQGGHFNQYLATFEPMVTSTIEFQGQDFISCSDQEIQYDLYHQRKSEPYEESEDSYSSTHYSWIKVLIHSSEIKTVTWG